MRKNDWKPGTIVRHPRYGQWTVLSSECEGFGYNVSDSNGYSGIIGFDDDGYEVVSTTMTTSDRTVVLTNGPKERPTFTGDPDIDECIQSALDVMAPKNRDYSESNGDGDRLYNFRQVAKDLGLSMEMVLYVYLWKHIQAVKRYCREGKVDSEGIKGRIVDSINYLEILYKMVCEREHGEADPPKKVDIDEEQLMELIRGMQQQQPNPPPYNPWVDDDGRYCMVCGNAAVFCRCVRF